jgi:hypothetical protein
MTKYLLSVAVIALSIGGAHAGSTTAIGGGVATGVAGSVSHVTTSGLAFGAAGSASVNASQGAGVAVATPVGSLSAGIGQSTGLSATRTGVVGALGGTGTATGLTNNIGFGAGAGFTNTTP